MLKVDIVKCLPDFCLQVAFELEREILVLFGPSGAGKSLTLNCIAGLMRPDKGLIQLGERILFCDQPHRDWTPPHKRGIGVVFQGYALFPHLTVAQNLTYGLRYHHRAGKDVAERLKVMLKRLRLENLAGRYPHQLSGGQQQRVALGRALIIRPQLLLLDEPFAALDVGVREQLQKDILHLQQELQLTIIYVTHNLEDAFALGDKLAVLQAGQLQQLGEIGEVFHGPKNRPVAEITGVKNIWEGIVQASTASGLALKWGRHTIDLPPERRFAGEEVIFYIRPEHVKIIHPHKPIIDTVKHNLLKATIKTMVDRGTNISMTVVSEDAPEPIQIRFPRHSYEDLGLHIGEQVTISLLRDFIVTLPVEH